MSILWDQEADLFEKSIPISIHSYSKDLVINKRYINIYNNWIDIFHKELVLLNSNIFILDHILVFPFHLFNIPGGSIFFRFVFESFYSSSILIITKLFLDEEGYSMKQFKNKLVMHYIKKNYKALLVAELKVYKSDKDLDKITTIIKSLRNTKYAHLDKDLTHIQKRQAFVKLEELKQVCEYLNKYFNSMTFNSEYLMLSINYLGCDDTNLTKKNSDISVILDSIVINSSLFNLPENNSELWEYRKKTLKPGDLTIFNQYRSKLGRPIIKG